MPWANDRDARRRSDATYDTTYRRNRATAMRRDKWRCQLRLEGCAGAAAQCDHIRSPQDGGSNAVENLRAVCKPCHAQRTATQGGGFRSSVHRPDPSPQPRTTW